MPLKAMKRSASKAGHKSGGVVTKKCRMLVSTIRDADVPKAVRTMLCDTLVRTFGTYKENRHPLQNTVSKMVGEILEGARGKLQGAINEAQQKHATLERDGSALISAKDGARLAFEAAAKHLADSKMALADGKAAHKDAKTVLHDLESAAKDAKAALRALTDKKQSLETLQGKHVAKMMGDLEPEFVTCVARTFSKPREWFGTFDNIVDKRLEEARSKVIAAVTADVTANESANEARAANIEAAKGAIVAADESAKAMEAAAEGAATAAKEADAAAKVAAGAAKSLEQQIHKAADACTHADEALAAFTNEQLAAYAEVEARAAPPPEPEAEKAEGIEAAMEPAPAPAARSTPSILPSPGVLSWVAQASGLSRSPQIAQTPRVA